jgi:hypothetical protein
MVDWKIGVAAHEPQGIDLPTMPATADVCEGKAGQVSFLRNYRLHSKTLLAPRRPCG